MTVLSDRDIREALGRSFWIEPLDESMIRPSSIRLRLGSEFLVMQESEAPIDTRSSDTRERFKSVVPIDGRFVIAPRTLVLVASLEKIGLSTTLTGILNTVSSLARIGLSTHGSSSLVPAGYGEKRGARITFELYSFSAAPIVLYQGMPVCHLSLFRNETPADQGYETGGGFYKGDAVEPANFDSHPTT